MKNRAVRIALFLVVVLALVGAGYEVVLLQRQATTAVEAGRAFDEKARHAEATVRELRAAQFAYVATGQGSEFWMARARTLLPRIEADLKSLCAASNAGADARSLEPSCTRGREHLATVQRIDTSVHTYLGEQQRLLASDLVFLDLREADQALLAWIDQMRRQRNAAYRATEGAALQKQIGTAAGAAIFAVLVLVLLVPIGRRADTRATDPAEAGSHSVVPRGATGLGLGGVNPARPLAEPKAAAESRWPPAAAEPGTSQTVDFASAAALCTDLACVRETSDLPPLLARVAALLDAAGLIVWVDDGASGQLRPVLSHGYSAQVLGRMRGIPKDADNATASACRERRLRTVEGDAHGTGAIAAPLLSSDGCVGVMAAEIRHGRERDGGIQAVATMIAAQIATLIAPQSAGRAGVET